MSKNIFKKSIIAGGLLEFNDSNIYLRSVQIKDNLYIHTCNDYGKSLEVIKAASIGIKEKVKIISKVYYKYPDVYHRRFRPIYDQLEEQKNRLGFIPHIWEIQICCFCPIRELFNAKASNFFNRIKNEFGIRKIYLEYYPVYKYQIKNLIKLNKFYKSNFIFGLIGYQNLTNRVFDDILLKNAFDNSIEIIFIGILGKGLQKIRKDKISEEITNDQIINMNFNYFLKNIKNNNLLRGITSFSSEKQYEDLYRKYIDFESNKNDYEILKNPIYFLRSEINYFNKYDQYGGYFTMASYLSNPKILFSKIKYLIFSFLKSFKFNNNFFG